MMANMDLEIKNENNLKLKFINEIGLMYELSKRTPFIWYCANSIEESIETDDLSIRNIYLLRFIVLKGVERVKITTRILNKNLYK